MTTTTDLPQHSPELRAAARHIGRRRFLTVTGAAARSSGLCWGRSVVVVIRSSPC